MSDEPNISVTAALIAEPARTAMLIALIDGRALPAGELAQASSVTPATASAHLAKLLEGGLLSVETEGRHRYYRLAGPHVAEALEHLAAIRPPGPVRRKAQTTQAKAFCFARCCYNHLAGKLGVGVARALQERDILRPVPIKVYEITPKGREWFSALGVDVEGTPRPRAPARQCLDWTERTHHVAGPVGVRMLEAFCRNDWLRREAGSRAMRLTPVGRTAFREVVGVRVEELESD